MLPWSAVSHPSRASHGSSYHILNLIINQSSSSTPYLVLPSSKIELKVKKKPKHWREWGKWQKFFLHFCQPGIRRADTTTHFVSRIWDVHTGWDVLLSIPQTTLKLTGLFWPFLWSKCAWHDGRTHVMTQKMVNQCFNFIEDWFAIFYF